MSTQPIHYSELARNRFLNELPESFDSPHEAIQAGYRSLSDWCELLAIYRHQHDHTDLEHECAALLRVRDPCVRQARRHARRGQPSRPQRARPSLIRPQHARKARKGAE